jgi:hypothetical protein
MNDNSQICYNKAKDIESEWVEEHGKKNLERWAKKEGHRGG